MMRRDKKEVGTIYIIRNSENDKVYIGKTTDPLTKRMNGHKSQAKSDKKVSANGLINAMRSIGADKFSIMALEKNVPIDKLFEKESYYIQKYNAHRNGYNIRAGGKGGVSLSESEIEDVLRMANNRIPATKIAKKYNVHAMTIFRALKANGFKYNAIDEELIIRLFEDGFTYKAIAEQLGVHKETILRHLKKNNLKRNRPLISKRDDLDYDEIKRDYYSQMDICEICKKHNINRGSFYNLRKKLNMENREKVSKRWRNRCTKTNRVGAV